MERQDYINQITSLQATVKSLLNMIDTLRQTLDSVNASSKRNEDLVKKLSAQIEAYQKQIRNLEDMNHRHNKKPLARRLIRQRSALMRIVAVKQFMEKRNNGSGKAKPTNSRNNIGFVFERSENMEQEVVPSAY